MTQRKIAIVHGLKQGGAHRRLVETLHSLSDEIQEFTLSDADTCTPDAVVVKVWTIAKRLPHIVRPPFRYLDYVLRRFAYFKLSRAIDAWGPDAVFMNPCHILKSPTVSKPQLAKAVFWLDELPRSLEMDELRSTTRPLTRGIYAPLREFERWSNRRIIKASAVVLTNSRYMADLISEVYERPVIPEKCGVSAEFSCVSDNEKRNYIISVGSLIPGKGHDLTIKGLGQSGLNLDLVIVTHRPNHDEIERLNDIASQVGVTVSFEFGVSDSELAKLYRSALFTSYLAALEPFGLVSIESQACGTPALVSQEGGLMETILEGQTGLSVRRNVNDVARAMIQIASWAATAETRRACCDFGQSWHWEETAESVSRHLERIKNA